MVNQALQDIKDPQEHKEFLAEKVDQGTKGFLVRKAFQVKCLIYWFTTIGPSNLLSHILQIGKARNIISIMMVHSLLWCDQHF